MKYVILETNYKKIYTTRQADQLLYEFKPLASAPNQRAKSKLLVEIRKEISTYFFECLNDFRIPTFFIKNHSKYSLLVKNVSFIPLTFVIYNYVTGELGSRLDRKVGIPLQFPVFEYYYTNNAGQQIQVNDTHLSSIGLLLEEEFKIITRIGSKVNAVLKSLCERRNLVLARIEIAFGRLQDHLVISNEISPITVLFWKVSEDGKIIMDHFSYSGNKVIKSYKEIWNSLMLKI